MVRSIAIAVLLLQVSLASAGLHYSQEKTAPLPSKWRGYLLDQRLLQMVAVPGRPDSAAALLRQDYRNAVRDLNAKPSLTAEEAADLGALHIRLGESETAVEILRPAARKHPDDFRIWANLGTAWQLGGDLPQAEAALRQAVRLAPKEHKEAEELHLKLVRLRQRESDNRGLDDLFGVRYVGDEGTPTAGTVDVKEFRKLPENAVALTQQLGLWLPADGRLLWQLGELANANGDVRTGANILEGCVNDFGMTQAEVRERRRIYRAGSDKMNPEHETHNPIKWKSDRPLVREIDFSALPKIRADRVNLTPWVVLNATKMGPKYRPTFPEYLNKLEGKEVALTGFMQPLGDDLEANYFLFVEYPVGCWFCEAPDITGMVYAQLSDGRSMVLKNGLVKIEGRLQLNRDDPEDFLFNLRDARVKEAD